MKPYDLFAARDGDVFRASAICESKDAALRWAAERITVEFNLSGIEKEFYEMAGCCDGVLLEPVADPFERIIQRWALAQITVLDSFGDHFGTRFKAERSRCLQALVDLANVVRMG